VTVIDTSAFCKFLLKEPEWEKILELITSDSDLYGVGMLITESVNVIWKHAIKPNASEELGLTMYSIMEKLFSANVVTIEPDIKYIRDALQIGVKYRIPVYDSLFLAQSQHHKTTLVTCDAKQAAIAKKLHIPVEMM